MEQQEFKEYLLKSKSLIFQDVVQFNKEIIGTERRGYIGCLSDERLDFAVKVLTEEIDEFIQAHGSKDQVAAIDAMIDLIYYALGRLYELGLSAENFAHVWTNVHEANMKKKKGDKGRGTNQDAIKPEGWTEPKIDFYNNLTKEQVELLNKNRDIIEAQEANWQGPNINKEQIELLNINPECPNHNELNSKKIPDISIPSYKSIAQILGISRDTAKQVILLTGYPHEQETIFNMMGYVKESSITKLSDIPEPFVECALLKKKKGEDYRLGNIKMKDYFPFGLLSYAQMLHTKVLRLRSLIENNKKPNNESIRDTLLDTINYACFAIEAIDKKEV